MDVLRSLSLFVIAGVLEIGGGYLIWQWVRDGKSVLYGLAGTILLGLYGYIATFQAASFARVYATYGGVFIVMSLLWANRIDNYQPDKFDLIGAAVALIGVGIIYYAPRS